MYLIYQMLHDMLGDAMVSRKHCWRSQLAQRDDSKTNLRFTGNAVLEETRPGLIALG